MLKFEFGANLRDFGQRRADADIVSDSFGPINAQIAGGETNRLHLVLLLEDAHEVERLLPANLVEANVHLRGDCKGSTQCLGLEFRRAHTDVSDALTAQKAATAFAPSAPMSLL